MDVQVRDNREARRFEAQLDAGLALAEYRLAPGVITFTHTEVPRELRGRGVASALARGALEAARAQGLKVRPVCSFFADYIERHPETQDLLEEPPGR